MNDNDLRWYGLHAFVAMPFGTKEGIDFNKVYRNLIEPALASVGFTVIRADKEMRAGNIRTDMFQELLLADLVVVDLSIDNPNVWYELGVRHALRSRGVIQIQSQRKYMPFDVYVDRTLKYYIKNGIPDPATLEDDKKKLAEFAIQTMNSWFGRKISPVYHLLQGLQEPEWKKLQISTTEEFRHQYEIWANLIELARKRNRPGDILVLAEEAPTWVLRLEAVKKAGKALLSLSIYDFALEQYERALAIDPTDLESRQQKGIILGRLKKYNQAKLCIEGILKDHPDDAESWGLLGRIEKDTWCRGWRNQAKKKKKRIRHAKNEDAFLSESIKAYRNGFYKDPSNYYPGINAVALIHLFHYLTGNNEYAKELKAMENGIRWILQTVLAMKKKDYWARATLGDLEVLTGNRKRVERAYRDAVAVAEKDWFALDSTRQQLRLMDDLGFRPKNVRAGIRIFDKALSNLKAPEKQWQPRMVFLFSGHMIDKPGRKPPRFPADVESVAANAIAEKLDELGAGKKDLALCGGACGGDLLFAEACLQRGLHLELRLPLAEPEFIQESVIFAGEQWRNRFYDVKKNESTQLLIMPDELGPLPKSADPFERNNLWQLYSALSRGAEKVFFLCLWNLKGGDGPGGTKHMHDEVKKRSGQVHILDTNKIFKNTGK